jgi:hypothetical protein
MKNSAKSVLRKCLDLFVSLVKIVVALFVWATAGQVLSGVLMFGTQGLVFLFGYWISESPMVGALLFTSFLVAFALLSFQIELRNFWGDGRIASGFEDDQDFRASLYERSKFYLNEWVWDGIVAFIGRHSSSRSSELDALQKTDRARRLRVLRALSFGFLIAYATAVIFVMWKVMNYTFYVDSLSEGVKALAPFSLVAALVSLSRRSHADGYVRGYLNGYLDASEKASSKSGKDYK